MLRAYPLPDMTLAFKAPLIARPVECYDSHIFKLIRRKFLANPCSDAADLDIRTTWGEMTLTGDGHAARRNTAIHGPDGFALVILGSGGAGILVERLEGPDRAPQDADACRLHPLELKVRSDIAQRGAPKGQLKLFRLGMEMIDGCLSFVLSKRYEHKPFVPLEGASDSVVRGINDELRAKVSEALKAEIAAWADVAKRVMEQNKGPDARWPAPLCRDMLPDKARAAELSRLFQDVTTYVVDRCKSTERYSSTVHLHSPGQDGTPSYLSLIFSIGETEIDIDARRRADALFQAEVERLWPEGWHRTIGPWAERGLVSPKSHLKKMHIRGDEPASSHQRLAAYARLAPIDAALSL